LHDDLPFFWNAGYGVPQGKVKQQVTNSFALLPRLNSSQFKKIFVGCTGIPPCFWLMQKIMAILTYKVEFDLVHIAYLLSRQVKNQAAGINFID
jgi:hypothetical protein